MNASASGNDLELWHVQLGGAVRTMTLDELDNAFQSGVIDERTHVLKAGALHWTTLGDVAGIEDEPSIEAQPNSIAPMATDIAPSHLVIPPLDPANFDVSFGTEELAVFKPKRRVGRAFFAVALVAAIGGGLFAAKSYGVDGLRAKASQVASLVKSKPTAPASTAMAAAVAAPPPAAMDVPASGDKTISINSLPAVGALAATSPAPPPPDKNAKKKKAKAKAKGHKGGKKKHNANDPTQKGSGQFDPLDGTL